MEYRSSAQHVLKILQGLADTNTAAALEHEFPDGALMMTAAFLEQRQSRPYRSRRLEKAHADDGISQIADIHGRLGGHEHPVLRENEKCQHAALVQVGGQLVQLIAEVTLARHGVQVAVERVDDHQLATARDCPLDAVGELPGRDLGRVDLLQADRALAHEMREVEAELLRAGECDARGLVKGEYHAGFALARHLCGVLERERGFAGAGLAENQSRGAPIQAAAEELIELLDATGHRLARQVDAMLGSNQSREDTQSPRLDDVVVVTLTEAHRTHFHDPQPPARSAVFRGELLHFDHAVGEAEHMRIAPQAAAIHLVIQQQYRAALPGELLLQSQELPTIAQRRLREQPKFRQRVEDHTRGPELARFGEEQIRDRVQLHLGGMKDRGLRFGTQERVDRRQLEKRNLLQRPIVRARDLLELGLCLRQGDVEDPLSAPQTFEQELQRQGRLARTGISLNEIEAVARQPAGEHLIEARDSRGAKFSGSVAVGAFRHYLSPKAGSGWRSIPASSAALVGGEAQGL